MLPGCAYSDHHVDDLEGCGFTASMKAPQTRAALAAS